MTQTRFADVQEDLRYLMGSHPATRLIESPPLAQRARVGRVFLKAEWERPLGNFKMLGGMLAGLRALARSSGAASIAALLEDATQRRDLPRLICASDGNHGLAVAAAARRAGAGCSIYLPAGVSRARVARITAQGAMVVTIRGTYDDAVDAAAQSATRGEGLLVADTTQDPYDAVVQDVMAGYSLIARELLEQFGQGGNEPPTHMIVQAGVGGLAAAMVSGLADAKWGACQWLIVEPASAACVARALAARRPVRIDGSLETSAEMLSCGLASAPALTILQQAGVIPVGVDEAELLGALHVLKEQGIETTPSGAAGVAGLLHLRSPEAFDVPHGLDDESRVLLLITEGPLES